MSARALRSQASGGAGRAAHPGLRRSGGGRGTDQAFSAPEVRLGRVPVRPAVLLAAGGIWQATYFAVTEVRMVLVSGFMVRKVAMMPLARVTDMSFRRSALGRLLGYGEFIVESAGEEQALRTLTSSRIRTSFTGGLRPSLPGRGGRDPAGSRRLAALLALVTRPSRPKGEDLRRISYGRCR